MCIKSSETINELSEALAKAQSSFRAVAKSGDNKFDKYSYAKLEDYVAAIQGAMTDNGLFVLIGTDRADRLPDRKTAKGGTEHAVQVEITARVVHRSGQWIEAKGVGEGQDRADKAIYKAITGARKYALASIFGLATTDDPEGDETTGQTAPPKAATGKEKSDKGSAKDLTLAAVKGWSGVAAADVADAVMDCFRAAGVTIKDRKAITDKQWSTLLNWVNDKRNGGVDFTEATSKKAA